MEKLNKRIQSIAEQDIEQNKDISLERVKTLALQGITQDSKNKVVSFPRLNFKKRWLPLVASLTLFATPIMAIGYNSYSHNLFGETYEYVAENVNPINKSVEFGTLRLTIQESLVVDSRAIIIATTEKINGDIFEDNSINYKWISGYSNVGNISSTSYYSYLSDNKQQLITILEHDIERDSLLYGEIFTLVVEDLGYSGTYKINDVDINLSSLYKQSSEWEPVDTQEHRSINPIVSQIAKNSLNHPLGENFPEGVNIARVQYEYMDNWQTNVFSIICENAELLGDDYRYIRPTLTNIETGEEIPFNSSSVSLVGDEQFLIFEFHENFYKEYLGIDLMENLDKMQLSFEIDGFNPLFKGEARIDIELTENITDNFIINPTNLALDNYLVEQIILTPAYMQINGVSKPSNDSSNKVPDNIELLYKDGTTQFLYPSSYVADEYILDMQLDIFSNDLASIKLIDIDNILGIVIDGEIITFEQ